MSCKILIETISFENTLLEIGIDAFYAYFLPLMSNNGCDILIRINNQSKEIMPNFGEEMGGVPCSSISQAGPNLITPYVNEVSGLQDEGGYNVFWENELLQNLPLNVLQESFKMYE